MPDVEGRVSNSAITAGGHQVPAEIEVAVNA